jgi:hypothetical protein
MDVTGRILCRSLATNHAEHFGLKEAAAYLSMKPEALRNGCHARRVTCSRLNYRSWRFTEADLDNFISRYTFLAKALSES